jgi:ABC-type Na+ transport system ATPase subunit NatA
MPQNKKNLAQSVVEPLAGLCDDKHITNLTVVHRKRLDQKMCLTKNPERTVDFLSHVIARGQVLGSQTF